MPSLARYEKGLTICESGEWKTQKNCVYAKKSTFMDKCIFYISNTTGRCDNVDAQEAAARNKTIKK